MPEVPVNGKVLEWARGIRGLELGAAADLLQIPADELRSYESGERKPMVGILRRISDKYQVNFTSLLMPEPLPPAQRPPDYRANASAKPLSMETLIAIEEVTEALDAFEDIAGESNRLIPKLRIGTATLNEDPEAVASQERKRFAVSIEDQKHWPGLDGARREWRKRIEERGVFTYMIPMGGELSGFSFLRQDMAAICINDNEPNEGRKIFTLFHEYCHLLLRQTGISDEGESNQVERFCNEFAASFLIPKRALSEMTSHEGEHSIEYPEATVARLATRFRVSNRAMALRLEKLRFAPKGFYARLTAAWEASKEPEPEPPAKAGTPNYITLRLKRIGKLHARTILEAVDRHAMNSFDASELIGINPSSFPKLRAGIG